MNLNTNERDYYESLLAKISTLPHGLSFKITQLFDKDPVSPRICRKFYEDVKECVDDGNMVHFYPEASMWYYYQGLREFKPGCFVLAAKCNKPVVPLAISFRPAKGLYKLWKRKGYPTCTVEVGKPIFPDNSLEFKDCVNKLKDDCYKATKEMMEKNTPVIKEK